MFAAGQCNGGALNCIRVITKLISYSLGVQQNFVCPLCFHSTVPRGCFGLASSVVSLFKSPAYFIWRELASPKQTVNTICFFVMLRRRFKMLSFGRIFIVTFRESFQSHQIFYFQWMEVMFSSLSFCLSVCLSVSKISQKITHGFGRNFVVRLGV